MCLCRRRGSRVPNTCQIINSKVWNFAVPLSYHYGNDPVVYNDPQTYRLLFNLYPNIINIFLFFMVTVLLPSCQTWVHVWSPFVIIICWLNYIIKNIYTHCMYPKYLVCISIILQLSIYQWVYDLKPFPKLQVPFYKLFSSHQIIPCSPLQCQFQIHHC